MEPPDMERAIAAATTTTASLGLRADDATVLHNSNRLAVRLTPCDVLARVAPTEHRAAQSELDLARRLARAGCPVGTVERRVEPRAYAHDGFTVTLWTYYEPVTSHIPPDEYAETLERLHTGMRAVDVPSPSFTDRIAEAEKIAADPERSPALPDADRTLLTGTLAGLRRSIAERGAEEQLLHGEPHPGNLLGTEHGPLFIDLETYCRGPVEFDLAHVPGEVAERYPNVDAALLEDCRGLVLAMVAAWRWDEGDQFPDGGAFGAELLRVLRGGPPWPGLDAVVARVRGG